MAWVWFPNPGHLTIVATGPALLMLGAAIQIGARIEQAERSICEQILRIECRITAFAEALARSRMGRDYQNLDKAKFPEILHFFVDTFRSVRHHVRITL